MSHLLLECGPCTHVAALPAWEPPGDPIELHMASVASLALCGMEAMLAETTNQQSRGKGHPPEITGYAGI